MTEGRRVVVIGAGIGGLAASAILARDGYQVTLIEKRDEIGGRASCWKKNGFCFDMGPSWYLMPDIFERFFAEFNCRPSDFYQLKRLDPSYKIFFGDNDSLEISSDLSVNLERFEQIEPGASDAFRKYLEQARLKYNSAVSNFLYRELTSIFDFLNKEILKAGKDLHALENLDHYTKRFFTSEKLRRVLEYSMVFLGGAPSNTPAIYSMLSHVDFNLGVWYPQGGMWSVVNAIKQLALRSGAKITTSCEATQILVRNGIVKAVKTTNGDIPADIVLANADYPFVETILLERAYQSYPEKYWQKRVLAPSAIMMYLGLDGTLPNMSHHTLSFEQDWMEHFNSIFDHPEWPSKPSFYFCCPTKTDSSVAPQGCENLVTLIPVAPGLEDTDQIRDAMCQKTFECLKRITGIQVESMIRIKRVFSHRDYISEYNARKGTALGLSHTLMQSAIFRPRIASRKVRGLYYVGQYTHPGIGVPMALISATVACNRIRKDRKIL